MQKLTYIYLCIKFSKVQKEKNQATRRLLTLLLTAILLAPNEA